MSRLKSVDGEELKYLIQCTLYMGVLVGCIYVVKSLKPPYTSCCYRVIQAILYILALISLINLVLIYPLDYKYLADPNRAFKEVDKQSIALLTSSSSSTSASSSSFEMINNNSDNDDNEEEEEVETTHENKDDDEKSKHKKKDHDKHKQKKDHHHRRHHKRHHRRHHKNHEDGNNSEEEVTKFIGKSYFPEVNNRKLHFRCYGDMNENNNDIDNGNITILFEAGTPFYSTVWGNVLTELPLHLQVSKLTSAVSRYCVYDRYGYGWSDFYGESIRSDQMADDLHGYLSQLGINNQLIYVGWSYGGILAQQYATLYPDTLTGIVLVDSMDIFDLNDTLIEGIVSGVRSFTLLDIIRSTGIPRVLNSYPLESGFYDESIALDGKIKKSSNYVYLSSDFLISTVLELEVIMDSLALMNETIYNTTADTNSTLVFGDIPLVVLTAGLNQDNDWMQRQSILASYSSVSKHVVATDSNHFIPLFQPNSILSSINVLFDLINDTPQSYNGLNIFE